VSAPTEGYGAVNGSQGRRFKHRWKML